MVLNQRYPLVKLHRDASIPYTFLSLFPSHPFKLLWSGFSCLFFASSMCSALSWQNVTNEVAHCINVYLGLRAFVKRCTRLTGKMVCERHSSSTYSMNRVSAVLYCSTLIILSVSQADRVNRHGGGREGWQDNCHMILPRCLMCFFLCYI